MDHVIVGYSDFRKIIEKKIFWIDKSLLIKDIIEEGAEVILIPRPRRFGKTSNLSMLQHFFANEVEGRPTAHLFEELKIAKIDGGRYLDTHQGKYPVIFVTFKTIKYDTFDEALSGMRQLFSKLFQKFAFLLEEETLKYYARDAFEQVLNATAEPVVLRSALKNLSDSLSKYYKQRVVVLIDEYDAPIQHAHSKGYYEKMTDLMRGMLLEALKDNSSLHRGVLTGVLRISKESMFSDLKNVSVYSILDEQYSEYFGFTESEVDTLLSHENLLEQKDKFREWYNGYRFGSRLMYNPWSIASSVQRGGVFQPYWANTSENRLIRELLEKKNLAVSEGISRLLRGEPIEKRINDQLPYSEVDGNMEVSIWSLLLMSGYLRASVLGERGISTRCSIDIPNKEVRKIYEESIRNWLGGEQSFGMEDNFLALLLKSDLVAFKARLALMLTQVVSFRDLSQEKQEAFYHGLLLGMLVFLDKNTHEIQSNRESGYGLYDIAIFPKDITQQGVILELKSVQGETDKIDLKPHAQDALAQIEEKKYEANFKQRGIKNVLKVGLAFHKKYFSLCSNLGSEL